VQLSASTSTPSKRSDNAWQTAHPKGPNEREPNSLKINDQLQSYIGSAVISHVNGDEDDEMNEEELMKKDSRTELDSHANMPVVGKCAFIISDTGRVADVKAYTPDYDSMTIRIIDAAVKYDCPYDGTAYILVIWNALHVPSVQHNLIPPFMMHEAGITVFDTPQIQMFDPSDRDHSLYFPETRFRRPMSLWGVFSYFPTSKPMALEMTESEDVYMLTPSRWDPHQIAYAENEDNMLDWEGNIIDKRHCQQIILSDIEEDTAMAVSVYIGSIEVKEIDRVMETVAKDSDRPHPSYKHVPRKADQVSSILASVSPILNDQTLCDRMVE
jgi:hypothetical protein